MRRLPIYQPRKRIKRIRLPDTQKTVDSLKPDPTDNFMTVKTVLLFEHDEKNMVMTIRTNKSTMTLFVEKHMLQTVGQKMLKAAMGNHVTLKENHEA